MKLLTLPIEIRECLLALTEEKEIPKCRRR